MNNLTLMGRLTRDPEIRYSSGENSVAYGSYTLAVDRPRRNGAEQVTDFIYCKVVGKNAEFAEKYLRQGMKIAIVGRIQVDKYKDNNGNDKSTTYVQVQNQEFCESKSSGNSAPQENSQSYYTQAQQTSGDGFMNVPEGLEEDLPFA
ncbi:MAG: single-stranded DNA-binding protein [Erysipelotrichaceae bacterium]|nr:single-stranded DNA-binding protein [Erysipelotrichaceae bacterium]